MHEVTVWQEGDKALTSSRNVAEVFGKEHKNVLRDIDELMAQLDDSFRALNFELSEYTSGEGNFQKAHREYHLTKDGFTLLAMGFTGKRAIEFKLAYIHAFNALQAKHQQQALVMQEMHIMMAKLIERQDAFREYMQEDLREMAKHHQEALKHEKKMLGELAKAESYRERALSYEDHLFALAHDLGMLARNYGYSNPAGLIEQRGQIKSYAKKRRKK
ncbi:Rha family transcriptional regulator (plasmid) [Entomospira entomophila]|uniref:Rha family transcriptional regulator n=1 Tax=Entomospira entomophila TaxID=2719988 RepID=A0A968GBK7_9SPIO|nr:Rha family transcriptional regulator [Entomospira entomophilus]NIZ41527.1 Rha family transcriptional regulator [Entomospira entomophilus]WDI36445.1 Rha family transcriptional regulator [Entomospira entomophilus]